MSRPLPRRIFFDWSRQPLITAAEWLVENYARNPANPLPLLVLPTSRACRRINELYGAMASASGLSYFAFETTTVGELPEFLYDQEKASASPLLRNLAWINALRQLPKIERDHVFPGLDDDDISRLSSLAARLQSLHERLGADIWSFKSVAREIAKLPDFPQDSRWQSLSELQGLYYQFLSKEDLWDPQAARNVAIRREICRSGRPIVLIGLADLNRGPREMLMQCSAQVTSLVFCDPNDQSGFDEIGCLNTEYWQARQLSISDRRIRIVDRPIDQASIVSEFLVACKNKLPDQPVAIGLPDNTVWPQIERATAKIGISAVNTQGLSLADGAVVKLLERTAEYLDDHSYSAFAEVIRHPDISLWISTKLGRSDWLNEVDNFQNEALPSVVDLGKVAQYAGTFHNQFPVSQIVAGLRELFEPIMPKPRPLNEWADGWMTILLTIYGKNPEGTSERSFHQHTVIAAQRIAKLMSEISENRHANLRVETAVDSLNVCLRCLDSRFQEAQFEPDAIEALGWLDLPFEDSPSLVVTGMNNHVVPSNESGHAFLPNALCVRLGLVDNRRRMARDVYVLGMMDACRPNLLLIVGRRDSQRNPLQISRLLLHCDDSTLVRRTTAFFGVDRLVNSQRETAVQAERPKIQQFSIPRPTNIVVPSPLSVTRFRDYLKCPYRFYLGVILKLTEVSDSMRELDGGQFGDLAHQVFEAFGRNDIRDSENELLIKEFLKDSLSDCARSWSLKSQLPSLTLQIENLELRLETFAKHQANQRQQGWAIVDVEQKFDLDFDVDGRPFAIRGKIDRIDRHTDGRIAVWDYKTGESGKTAESAHRKKDGTWVDLQLPLYRHLVSTKYREATANEIELGYILLPNNTSKIEFDRVAWTAAELESADDCAREVVRKLRAETFWPPVLEPPQYSDATREICQDDVFERWVEQAMAGQ